ncbi:restriction endonuclease subunit S [Mycoplasma sp. T363T]|uniref:restriction endonuclease subunit S n=1 Tax=Mycoplasma bradburyae TaxID=2963128 RepID=UPI0023418F37|nr:restriction endonuclease subunit S [Mycoplasma bradburyae]MDC4163700.1 restriction endonuclease subunit S [Mycoplasma bradburyae]
MFIKEKDILISLTGNVGRTGIVFTDNCLLNQRLALIKTVRTDLIAYIFNLFKGEYLKKKMNAISNGSAQKNLSPLDVEKILIPWNSDIQKMFSNKFNLSVELIVNNLEEIHKLQKLKEYLLPLLMNGQATID